jgi:multidrug efflux pump
LLPVAPLPQVDFPHHPGPGRELPGASPETMASSVATPLERQFGRIAGVTEMTSTSFARVQRQHHHAVRSESQHRRRGARRAGGDQCRARQSADQPAEQSDLSQGQSGRCADHDPGADSEDVRPGQMYDAASTILAQKLSQVQGVGQVNVGGGALPAVRVE